MIDAGADLPTLTIEDDSDTVVALLRTLQRAVLAHPEATRDFFAAMVREGQLFAQTQRGALWKERLARSALVSRAQLVAYAATFWTLEQDRTGATPSALVEAIAAAASVPGRDQLLERLLRELDGSQST
jgi:hypothetical protein